tara:strand:+ start:185 stop:1372 length:1188 start_codon:yes stop_codon:yes gene_type:complete
MGFFSKAWKGIKKGVKSIGKSIKGAFKKFGKFMGEIGILGQMAMMFILPGIGNAILGTAGTAATVAGVGGATVTAAAIPASGLLGGALGSVGVAAGKAAVWVGNKVAAAKSVFSNITQGVVETAGNFAKTATNKLANTVGMDNVFSDAATNFFGSGSADSAFGRSFGADSRFQNLTGSKDFFKDIKETRLKAVADTNFEAIESNLPTADTSFSLKDTSIAETKSNIVENINLDTNSVYDPSQEALNTTQTFGEGTISGPTGQDFTFTKADSLLAKSQEPTFIENLTAVPGKIVDKFRAEAETFMADPFAGGAERLNSGLQTAGMQALGLEDKPEYTYNTMRSYVPEFQVASSGEYGAAPIMDARAFEQNVTNNSNPYGYTAFQYGQYMSQLGQTA